MTDRDKCKLILIKMKEAGYEDILLGYVDNWDEDEVDYFLANYEPHYLK